MEYRKIITRSGMTVSEIDDLIEERIFSQRDRYILKRLLLDGVSYERISEEVSLSTRYTKEVAAKAMKVLIEYMKIAL